MKIFVTVLIFFTAFVFWKNRAEAQSSCSFGMRLRKVPEVKDEVGAPVVLERSPANESTILRLPDGTLKIFFINRPGQADKMMSVSSLDNGFSWGKPQVEFTLPGIAYHANTVLLDDHGNVHCVFHIFGKGDKGYRGRQLNLWYCHTIHHGKDWSQSREIYNGYVGSVRGFIELKNKRLLLAFARAVPSREEKLDGMATIDYGWNDIISLYSDDNGATWQRSVNTIKVAVDSRKKSRYGGIEPAILQLTDGKVWMLIRTNKGYLYQSFSKDGGRNWQSPTPTRFISSDSPASLLRLSDNRILVFWCSDQRHDDPGSYANGGREVLHAAITGDEGRTWKGFREVLISNFPSGAVKGDHGTAYPSATGTVEGKVVLVSGQGLSGAIVMFDPDWLEEDTAFDDFSGGLVQWTFFGEDSTAVPKSEAGNRHQALQIRKPTEGVWNFPMTPKGKLILEITMNPGNKKGVSLALTDHFSISADRKASRVAPVCFTLGQIKDTTSLNVEIRWDNSGEKASLYCNGKLRKEMIFQRKAPFGFNYLRASVPGKDDSREGYLIRSVKMVTNHRL
ncbi:MAG TPA: sialidase family protein [Hanamia sp.]|nr:sialidase family protein [Hanamia sp.]